MPKQSKSPKSKAYSDMDVWHRVTQTVTPIGPVDRLPDVWDTPFDPNGSQSSVSQSSSPSYSPSWKPSLKQDPTPHKKTLPDLHHGDQPGLDKATARRMRRGQMNIEGRMDLHGLTQNEAHRALSAFIDACWHAGKREVLVITGKGTRRDGNIGVLRQAVPRWLNDYPLRGRVVAFSHASPKDGGEGALYVRLKKHG